MTVLSLGMIILLYDASTNNFCHVLSGFCPLKSWRQWHFQNMLNSINFSLLHQGGKPTLALI